MQFNLGSQGISARRIGLCPAEPHVLSQGGHSQARCSLSLCSHFSQIAKEFYGKLGAW